MGESMPYTLGQAARATGKAKPTIARAIQIGRLSASRADDGTWSIDPAELHRVYPMTGQTNGQILRDLPGEPASALAELLTERDRLVAEQAETILDLRARLDAEAEERRRLTAMLTDQRAGERPGAAVPRPRGWRRWFR
jgi:hypothetical protein